MSNLLFYKKREYILSEEKEFYLSSYSEFGENNECFCSFSYNENGEIEECLLGDYSMDNIEKTHYKSGSFNMINTIKYDELGRITEEIYITFDSIENSKEVISIKIFYNTINQIVKKIIKVEENGKIINKEEVIYEYDERGNCIYSDSFCGKYFQCERAEYNEKNQKIKTIQESPFIETEYSYDEQGTLIKTLKNVDSGSTIEEVHYDKKGRVISCSLAYSFEDTENYTNTYHYIEDEKGNIIEEKVFKNNILDRVIKTNFNKENQIIERLFYDKNMRLECIHKWEYIFK